MKIKGQRKAQPKMIGPPKPPVRPKVELIKDTLNQHINHINTVYSMAKTKLERQKKLAFSLSFFERKKKNLQEILNALANGISAKKIFVTFEDFDFHEFEEIGSTGYFLKLTKEIKNLDAAKKYTQDILKILN